MPIHIGWLVGNRVSYFQYVGDVTIDELEQASEIGLGLIALCDAPLLHTIQDNTTMTSFPSNAAALVKLTQRSLTDPGMGWMLSVGLQNRLTRQLAGLVTQITRTRYRIYETTDEAIAFLAYVDETLPDMTDVSIPSADEMLYHICPQQNFSSTK